MDVLTATDIRQLASACDGPCVSIFMGTHLGTNNGTQEIQQDPIRLKNLLNQARERLMAEKGMRRPDAEGLLRPGWQLIENGDVWREQAGSGLAVFLGPDGGQSFRVPLELEEKLVVNDRYFVKPLLPVLRAEDLFYILMLAQKDVRLLECTSSGISEVDLGDTPRDLATALRLDDTNPEMTWHRVGTSMGPASRKKTGGSSDFHGTGVDNGPADAGLIVFLDRLQKGVTERLDDPTLNQGTGKAPLVLAGIEFVQALYRDVNRYHNLYDQGIVGNAKLIGDTQLRDEALRLLQPYFERARHAAGDRFREYYGTGRASVDPAEIVPAAAYGRVESLLVADAHQWGRFDETTGELEMHDEPKPGDDDLSDYAVAKTLLTGGEVFAAEAAGIPQHSSMAAVFRY